MFYRTRKVMMSECGAGARLSLFSLINYLHDICEECDLYYGWGILKTREQGFCYVILSWDIEIIGRPLVNDTVTVRLYNNKNNGRFIVKSYEILDKEDRILCRASANIGVCGIESMHLSVITEEMQKSTPRDTFAPMPRLSLLNDLEKNEFHFSRSVKAPAFLCDVNGHVNNANYLHLIGEEIPYDFDIRRIQIYYYESVMSNETVDVQYCDKEDGRLIRIVSKETGVTKFLAYAHT